jgi:transcriptional regulator GlxA family with amidase domain
MTFPAPLKALFAIHPSFDSLDLVGPLEVFSLAEYPGSTRSTSDELSGPLFKCTITAISETTTSWSGVKVTRDIPMAEAYATLADYDVLVIPGGGSEVVFKGENGTEPMDLISAFAKLAKRADGKTRTLMSVCTGSLFLATAGVLSGPGFKATTHPEYYGEMKEILAKKTESEGKLTEVAEDRFIANKVDEEKGLRIITAGGVSSGIDGALWLVGEKAGMESMKKAEWIVQHSYREGVVL